VLHTPGGLVLAALQIAKAIREHKAKVTAVVPHYAMSGGTLIALAADKIVMCKHSVLGPIDPQLGQSPAVSLIKAVEEKPVAKIDDQTLVLAVGVLQLLKLYPQPVRMQNSGGVEYLPVRRSQSESTGVDSTQWS
jgi:ClpP class serine protease